MSNVSPGSISKVFIKTSYIQLCFPALPQSVCMTLGKSLSGWAADCSEQATVSPKQWELAFPYRLAHLHLPTMTPKLPEWILNPSQALETTLQSVLWM